MTKGCAAHDCTVTPRCWVAVIQGLGRKQPTTATVARSHRKGGERFRSPPLITGPRRSAGDLLQPRDRGERGRPPVRVLSDQLRQIAKGVGLEYLTQIDLAVQGV